MLVLGIESSCDETAAAVLRDGSILLSNVIHSQGDLHCRYGGVVPELASRMHIDTIIPVISEALRQGGITRGEIEAIGVTRGPGLIGSLLVGFSVAKAMAFSLNVPFVGVNHIEGHISAVFLNEEQPRFPFLALVVSGGHTSTYLVSQQEGFRLIGQTKDDAAGEAFDKGAKLLNIGYPGGILIDKLAERGNPEAIKFPRSLRGSLDFSFSGLKTSLLTYLKKNGLPEDHHALSDLAASYQEAIVDDLVTKTLQAAELTAVEDIVICGGVAANTRLRGRIEQDARHKGMRVFIPAPVFCTDNAAMIAVAAHRRLAAGRRDRLDINAFSRWTPLQEVEK
ncbi:MAG: tRNA (adenosine(37)-N6)-threonylcarbamoyltransferase complex transferase subunit TsaD [Smithellaceae bacterium]|nr:tRNA (adenosine(37)-N6)-threonylcarbamoyltransferase complex transferase subunit TsaD [Smithellaceae bacterium]